MTENLAGRGEGLAGLVRDTLREATAKILGDGVITADGWPVTKRRMELIDSLVQTCTEHVLAALEAAAPPSTAQAGQDFEQLVWRANDLLDRAKEAMECDPEADNVGGDCWTWIKQTEIWLEELNRGAALATPSPQVTGPNGPFTVPDSLPGHAMAHQGHWVRDAQKEPAATQEPAGSGDAIQETAVTWLKEHKKAWSGYDLFSLIRIMQPGSPRKVGEDGDSHLSGRIAARLDEYKFIAQMVSGIEKEGWYQRRIEHLEDLHEAASSVPVGEQK